MVLKAILIRVKGGGEFSPSESGEICSGSATAISSLHQDDWVSNYLQRPYVLCRGEIRPFYFQPARAHDLSAKYELLEQSGIGTKNMGESIPRQVHLQLCFYY